MARPAPRSDAPSPRVLLVDDHELFRAGLRQLLESYGIEVVAEAETGLEGVALARQHRPDVVLMDLNMPVMDGAEATREITATVPAVRVVVLSVSGSDDDVLEAIVAGAYGYLLKDASTEDLIRGITAAAVGESMISPAVAGRLLEQLRSAAPPAEELPRRSELSPQEVNVLRLIADGRNNAQIAAELEVRPKTVEHQISSILLKLQKENRIQAAVYAVRAGIV